MVSYRDFKVFSLPMGFLVFCKWPKKIMLHGYWQACRGVTLKSSFCYHCSVGHLFCFIVHISKLSKKEKKSSEKKPFKKTHNYNITTSDTKMKLNSSNQGKIVNKMEILLSSGRCDRCLSGQTLTTFFLIWQIKNDSAFWSCQVCWNSLRIGTKITWLIP